MLEYIKNLKENKTSLAIIGLGYVGLPIAMAFSKKNIPVIAFDINPTKIEKLKCGLDETHQISKNDLLNSKIEWTFESKSLQKASVFIVTVPTPIDNLNQPDLEPLKKACILIGKNLQKNSLIIFESTVYPGLTEEVAIPLIESASQKKWSKGDFFVGYSPERINPGDVEHTFTNITKVVSGQNEEVCEIMSCLYQLVVTAPIFKAKSIKVAEASKIIENTQRDLNIALMNELALIFKKADIDMQSVLEAASTKWNFISFKPGLVGGHCIGVDPYYLTFKAQSLGIKPQVILAGREINDSMATHVANDCIHQLKLMNKSPHHSKVLVLGLTFKENVPDFRNSKIFDLIQKLNSSGLKVLAYDPFLTNDIKGEFTLVDSIHNLIDIDAIILASPHQKILEISLKQLKQITSQQALFMDIKWAYQSEEVINSGFKYWRL